MSRWAQGWAWAIFCGLIVLGGILVNRTTTAHAPALPDPYFAAKDQMAGYAIPLSNGLKIDGKDIPWVPAPAGHPPLYIQTSFGIVSVLYARHTFFHDQAHIISASLLKSRVILLDPEDPPDDIQDSVLHELIHLSAHARDADYTDGSPVEEDFVSKTTPALLVVLKDNPELVKWLQK